MFKQELNGPLLAHTLLHAVEYFQVCQDLKQAEAARQESIYERMIAQYRQLAHNAKDLILVHNLEGKVVYVNPAVLEATGYTRDEALEMQITDFIPPETLNSLEDRRQKRLSGNKDRYYYEQECITASGDRLPIEVSSIPLEHEGDIRNILIFGRDISSRKEAEKALRERTKHLEILRNFQLEISSDLELEEILHSIVSQAVDLMDATAGGINFYQPELDILEFAVYTMDQDLPDQMIINRGEGLAGQIWETQQAMTIDDYAAWEGKSPAWVEVLQHAAVAGVPVRWGDEFLGVLEVMHVGGKVFTEKDLDLLELFAPQAAIAIHNATLFESMEQRVAEFRAIQRASLQLTSTLELCPVLNTVLESALSLVPADDAHIFLYEDGELEFGAALFEGEQQKEPYANPRPEGLTYTVARTGERVVVNDVKSHPIFKNWRWDGAILGLPLKIGSEVHGVMNVAFERPHRFSSDELRVLAFLADQAAIAIHNARLYEQAQTEIRERKRAEKALLESEERFRSLFERVPVGLYTTAPDSTIIDGNHALADMLGYPNKEALTELEAAELYQDPQRREQELKTLKEEGIVQGFEMQLKRFDGEIIWVQDTCRAVKDESGEILYYQGSLEDITERKLMEEAIKHMATHDALTGLPNRRLFNDRIVMEMARARRGHHIVAVLLLDLDNFKEVNDTLGHSIGDVVLKKVGGRLQSIFRESDTVARMGGDEFMVILPELEEKHDVKVTLQRILDTISEPLTISDHTIHLGTSIGVAFFPEDGEDVDTIIKNADIAMYRAKDLGGETYQYFSS
jgi:diguanylate cyclase (GGDEF)-like protein/PAS domain S-box-containing protein